MQERDGGYQKSLKLEPYVIRLERKYYIVRSTLKRQRWVSQRFENGAWHVPLTTQKGSTARIPAIRVHGTPHTAQERYKRAPNARKPSTASSVRVKTEFYLFRLPAKQVSTIPNATLCMYSTPAQPILPYAFKPRNYVIRFYSFLSLLSIQRFSCKIF